MSNQENTLYLFFLAIIISLSACKKDCDQKYAALCEGDNEATTSYGNNWYFIDKTTLLPDNQTTSIALDNNDNVWVSVVADTTYLTGDSTYLFDGQNGWWYYNQQTDYFTSIVKFNSLTNTSIIDGNSNGFLKSFTSQIGFDNANKLYVGTKMNTGLYIFNCDRSWEYNPQGGGYKFEDFLFDNNNKLWFGGGNSGLYAFNGTTFTNYDGANSIIPYPRYVHDIVEDNSGTKWFTTTNALLKLDSDFHIIYTDFYAQGMDNDSEGNLWIVNGPRLVKFHDSDTTIYPVPFSLNSNSEVQDVEVDENNNIWIATGGSSNASQGMLKFNGTSWTVFNTSNTPMPTNNLVKIKADKHNNIWVCSKDKGVMVYNENGVIY